MGAMADAIAAYAQPLIDQTDGSFEQVEKALAISQLCYNLALFPQDVREKTLRETQTSLGMSEVEFDDFRRSVIEPMIERHEQMFPLMHRRLSSSFFGITPESPEQPKVEPPADRYAPCPCGSGEKYKFCCGAQRR